MLKKEQLHEAMKEIVNSAPWTLEHDHDDFRRGSWFWIRTKYDTLGKIYEEENAIALLNVPEIIKQVLHVVTQQQDELCWLDIYTKLAELVGVDFDPKLLPPDLMLHNCRYFVQCLNKGETYETPDSLEWQLKYWEDKLSNFENDGSFKDNLKERAISNILRSMTDYKILQNLQNSEGDRKC